ncbi:MAG: ATP-dependent zinc protease [Myxococcota bacterium]
MDSLPGSWSFWVRCRVFPNSYRLSHYVIVGLLLGVAGCAGPGHVGAVEPVFVKEADLWFRARIDTGAGASSLHARHVRVDDGWVRFETENLRGERRSLSLPLADEARVVTAGGSEQRPRVVLGLALGGVLKRVPVSLRDRSAMQHRLLVGRDVLADDFVVDVSKPPTEAREAGP